MTGNLYGGEDSFASPKILPVADDVLIYRNDVWFALKTVASKYVCLNWRANNVMVKRCYCQIHCYSVATGGGPAKALDITRDQIFCFSRIKQRGSSAR